jgi:hypothetical protein
MADITEVILKGACAGQAIYNVLHFKNTGDLEISTLPEAMELGGATSWINELVDFICSDYSISSLLVRQSIDTVAGPQIEVPFSTTYTGQGGGSAEHLPTSAVIKWLTAVGGRSGRGRSYLGPLSSGHVIDGTITSSIVTAIEGFATSMLSVFSLLGESYNGNWEFGIWSRLLSVFNGMTGGIARPQAKTQRRRQLGVGI